MTLDEHRRTHRLLPVALWFIFYGSFTLFLPPLLDDADSVHAEVAREMLLRHDWTTLYANGIRYLEKAPILYWSMAASYKLFGVSAAAARLPLALAVLALALTLDSFARRAFGSAKAGLYAGLITLSSFGIFIFSRITIPDVVLCLWLTLAMCLFWLSEAFLRPPLLFCWSFAALCALDVLTKGLIGILFPLAIVTAYLLLTRGIGPTFIRLRQLRPLSSTLVFLLVAAPWHIFASLANSTQGHPGNLAFAHGHWSIPLPSDGNVHGWLWFYFVNEQLLRYLNLRVPHDYDTVPLALFWGLLLVWLMPWSAYLFHAVASALHIRKRAWRDRLRQHTLTQPERISLLLVLWAAIPMLFFSLSTRQEYYVLPSLPPLILLIAAWLALSAIYDNASEHPRPTHPGAITMVHASTHDGTGELASVINAGVTANRIAPWLLAAGSLASVLCLVLALQAKPTTDLAFLLQQNPAEYALSFGHFLDLNRQAMAFFRLPLILTALSLFAGSLANLLFRRSKRPHAANLSLAAGTFGFLLAAHLGLQTFAPILTSEPLARILAPQLKPQDLIVIHGEYEAASTLGFYLHRTDLHLWDGRSSNLWYGSFFPDAPHIFETTASIRQRWPGPQRIFLWQDPTDRDRPLPPLPGPVYPIARSGGKLLLSNQP